jgi:hypothetical protein
MTDIEININLFAQDRLSFDDLMEWFDKQEQSYQKHILDKLLMFVQQVHPSDKSIIEGIDSARIKKTMTPIVLIQSHDFGIALAKISELPDSELRKSFILVINFFKIADSERRENDCKNGCMHEWHNIDKG